MKVQREDMLKTVGQNALASIWQTGQTFMEEKWAAAIEGRLFEKGSIAFSELMTGLEWFSGSDGKKCASMEQLKLRLTRWNDQWRYEQCEMEATVGQIRKAELEQLEPP